MQIADIERLVLSKRPAWSVLTTCGVVYTGTVYFESLTCLAVEGIHSTLNTPLTIWVSAEHIVAMY